MIDVRQSFETLFENAQSRTGDVSKPLDVALPVMDADDLPGSAGTLGFGQAEGQCFMIAYVDSRRQFSRRLITAWNVVAGNAGRGKAICHDPDGPCSPLKPGHSASLAIRP